MALYNHICISYEFIAYQSEEVNDGNKKRNETNPITYTIDNIPLLVGGRFNSSRKSGNPMKLQNAWTATQDAKWLVCTNRCAE